jgi:hypothetical protein
LDKPHWEFAVKVLDLKMRRRSAGTGRGYGEEWGRGPGERPRPWRQ